MLRPSLFPKFARAGSDVNTLSVSSHEATGPQGDEGEEIQPDDDGRERRPPDVEAESDDTQSEREPAVSDQSAPETMDQSAFLSTSLPGFSAHFDTQHLTLLAQSSP